MKVQRPSPLGWSAPVLVLAHSAYLHSLQVFMMVLYLLGLYQFRAKTKTAFFWVLGKVSNQRVVLARNIVVV